MSIENVNRCDNCNVQLTEGDEIYCCGCMLELKKQIKELEKVISKMNEIILLNKISWSDYVGQVGISEKEGKIK